MNFFLNAYKGLNNLDMMVKRSLSKKFIVTKKSHTFVNLKTFLAIFKK